MTVLEQNPTLRDILATRETRDGQGSPVPLGSCIDAPTAEALFQNVRTRRPRRVVEVGMANGISTLAILSALEANGQGELISIDPNQSTQWRNCGRAAVGRAGLSHRHRVLEEPNWFSLPRLLSEQQSVDFGYIDGWHTFDYALVDFWYLDKMVPAGGMIAFNDCGWPAVEKAIQFMLTHRRYREYDAGLPRAYQRPQSLTDVLRKLRHGRLRDYWRQQQDRYFEKTEAWEPRWDFFSPF